MGRIRLWKSTSLENLKNRHTLKTNKMKKEGGTNTQAPSGVLRNKYIFGLCVLENLSDKSGVSRKITS